MIYSFIQSAITLKKLPRQGWIRVGIPISQIESIADHSYNTAMLSLLLCDLHNSLYPENVLDAEIVMRIAIVHDLPECKYQDFDRQLELLLGKDKYQEFKGQVITSASTELLSLILNEEVKKMWKKSLDGYASRNSREAKFVSYIDKLEVLVQALSYEALGYHEVLFDDFWNSSMDYLNNCPFDVINNILTVLKEERATLH
ncbi:MAG: HD domain-containing protein [Candidatus Heimdallarchaeota archaeon]|nr:HD domain-containing protein [Candidatus Heimdallarchaeota archaeon]